MEKKNLEIEGLTNLSDSEAKETNGGALWIGIAVAVALYLASEFDSIKQGVQDAKAGKEYNYKPYNC